jgi:hypothetical protein
MNRSQSTIDYLKLRVGALQTENAKLKNDFAVLTEYMKDKKVVPITVNTRVCYDAFDRPISNRTFELDTFDIMNHNFNQ